MIRKWQSRAQILKAHLDSLSPLELLRAFGLTIMHSDSEYTRHTESSTIQISHVYRRATRAEANGQMGMDLPVRDVLICPRILVLLGSE